MTEKNADVGWLRAAQCGAAWQFAIDVSRARRILAHIDQLESQIRSWEEEAVMHHKESREDRRPTVHEIAAANMQGLMARGTGGYASWQNAAVDCFDAAEALVAEGRRRDAAVRD